MDLQQKKAAILDALLEHKGIEHILSAASEVLDKPLMAINRAGTYAGRSHTQRFGQSYWDAFNAAMPMGDVMSEVEGKNLAARLIASDEVIFEQFSLYGREVMGTRMRDRVDVLGYISAVLETPLGADDTRVLVATARMVALELVYQTQQASHRDADSALVQSLLADEVDMHDLAAVEHTRGIDGQDLRLLTLCYPQSKDAVLYLTKSALDMNVGHRICAISGAAVVLVVDDAYLDEQGIDSIVRCAGECEGIGISWPFSGLSGFKEAYGQALAAVRIAHKLNSPDTVQRYEVLAPYHLFEQSAVLFDVSRFVDPAAQAILAYDVANGTELAPTLRAYIDCGRNMSICAERLFTHRNTVHYRLRRIEELTGVDLSDDNRCFAIGVSFRLLSLLDERA